MRHPRPLSTAAATAAVAALALTGCGVENSATEQEAPSSVATTTSSSSSSSSSSSTSSTSTSSTESSTSTQTPSATPTQPSTPTETATQTPTATATRTETASPTSTATESSAGSDATDDGNDSDDKDGDNNAAAGAFTVGADLNLGDSGERVKAAQTRLAGLGYWSTSADGSFGSGTRQSVYALQKAAGIPRTGNLDAATQKALAQGVVPKARTTTTGMEFDVAKQLLLVVDGGRVVKIINGSSGNGETFKYPTKRDEDDKPIEWATERAITTKGSFTVNREVDGVRESNLELGNLYRPKYFYGGIAVHGSDSVPPVPASHGCIRVTNATMDWIWSSGYMTLNKSKVTVY
ncbi:L,D-transpeptidase family protein [Dermacoccaceae bacterium W4C1]